MTFAGGVVIGSEIHPVVEMNAIPANKPTHVKASMIVESGFRKMLETLINTMYRVMYGDVKSPVCQIRTVIRTASIRNCSQICHVRFLLRRSRK